VAEPAAGSKGKAKGKAAVASKASLLQTRAAEGGAGRRSANGTASRALHSAPQAPSAAEDSTKAESLVDGLRTCLLAYACAGSNAEARVRSCAQHFAFVFDHPSVSATGDSVGGVRGASPASSLLPSCGQGSVAPLASSFDDTAAMLHPSPSSPSPFDDTAAQVGGMLLEQGQVLQVALFFSGTTT